MSRTANAARFGDGGIGGSWYNPPMPVDSVDAAARWPQYAQRAAWLHAQYPTGRIGVAGTGFAWTQYFLFANHSRQSWGFDVDWAITKASVHLGAWASFVDSLDVLNASDMGTTFRRMGNAGQGKYTVIFTEDLMPAMSSDAEVTTSRNNLLLAGTSLVHLITPSDPTATQTTDMLWHSMAEWKVLLPGDRIVTPLLVDVP